MLAGEEFSDHPMSVCRVIGSFLRSYNDSIDDEGRQDLYACAAKVVGSRGSKELEPPGLSGCGLGSMTFIVGAGLVSSCPHASARRH